LELEVGPPAPLPAPLPADSEPGRRGRRDCGWIQIAQLRIRGGRSWQGAPKKKTKNDVPTYLPFLRFFEIFRSDLRKYFYGVFGLLMQRNGQKRDKRNPMGKDERKKVFFLNFFGKSF
jgi:hypothetical protein